MLFSCWVWGMECCLSRRHHAEQAGRLGVGGWAVASRLGLHPATHPFTFYALWPPYADTQVLLKVLTAKATQRLLVQLQELDLFKAQVAARAPLCLLPFTTLPLAVGCLTLGNSCS